MENNAEKVEVIFPFSILHCPQRLAWSFIQAARRLIQILLGV